MLVTTRDASVGRPHVLVREAGTVAGRPGGPTTGRFTLTGIAGSSGNELVLADMAALVMYLVVRLDAFRDS